MKMHIMAILLMSFFAACSPYRIVQNRADESATWSTYQTFAFIDSTRINADPGNSYLAAMEQLKQAVITELQNRGYQPAMANPDVLVNLQATMTQKTQTRQTNIREAPPYMGQYRYRWQSQEVPVRTYQEGTVNLHLVDARRNTLIWDVAVSSVLNQRNLSTGQIREAVAKAFEKFPGSRR